MLSFSISLTIPLSLLFLNVTSQHISLCNIIYKIITKSIALCLERIIPKIISELQGGFVPGKDTMEGALIYHEVLHSIKIEGLQAMIINLDMSKAYDRLNWAFLS